MRRSVAVSRVRGMPVLTPRSITVARWTAAGQVLIASVLATVFTTWTIAWALADRAAAGAGHANDWSGLTELVGAVLTCICLGVGALLIFPVSRLGAGRPLARNALIAGELITLLPVAALLVLTITVTVCGVVFGAFVALGITTLVALSRPAARSWARSEPPCTARIPSDCAQA